VSARSFKENDVTGTYPKTGSKDLLIRFFGDSFTGELFPRRIRRGGRKKAGESSESGAFTVLLIIIGTGTIFKGDFVILIPASGASFPKMSRGQQRDDQSFEVRFKIQANSSGLAPD
jgi:hypothetical protein